MPNIKWFSIKAKDAAGSVSIRGTLIGPAFPDGSHPFEIDVEADGLVAKTRKSINPDLAKAFVDALNVMRDSGVAQPADLKSAVVKDFVLSLAPRTGGCNVTFSLRHGNANQWSVSFDLNLLLSDLEAKAGL